MYLHGPSCLEGPVSRARGWWTAALDVPETGSPTVAEPETEPMRLDLIERVRRQIAAGDYDTPEKWEIALDRLLDRLHADE